MGLLHQYDLSVEWTGAGETGTASYTSYGRDHVVRVDGKADLLGTADAAFRGDPTPHTPEDLLVAALAQCHMLWFLHLAAAAGVVVTAYTDRAQGTMRVESGGAGQFTDVVLHPQVVVRSAVTPSGEAVDDALLARLHVAAHEHCFIARSMNFPVLVEASGVHLEQDAPA